jgi:hypothetical protein
VIILRQVEALESVDVDFNKYVPLTITWSSASGVLEPPSYVELHGVNGYLELKFHPYSGILIEVVLAAASEIQVEQANLSPGNSNDANLMPFLDSSDTVRETGGSPVVKAYSDYLCVSFGPDPDHWVGSDPVLFGLAGEQSLTAICARWTSSERESVLTGRLDENRPRRSIDDAVRADAQVTVVEAGFPTRLGEMPGAVRPGDRARRSLLAYFLHLPPSAVSLVGDVRFRRSAQRSARLT